MNLDEYRAMVAQEEAAKNSQGEEQSNAQAVQDTTESVQDTDSTKEQIESTPPVEESKTETQDDAEELVFEVNGQHVTADELIRGYMRNADYTQKTQSIAQQRREAETALQLYQQVMENPELAQQLKIDPREVEYKRMQENYNDILLQQEINELSTKYADFDTQQILNFAVERQMTNLEDAYLLHKATGVQPSFTQNTEQVKPDSPINVEELKAQLRQELLAELETERNTNTLISTNGGTPPTTPTAPELSDEELRIARNMKMSPEEYAKWR